MFSNDARFRLLASKGGLPVDNFLAIFLFFEKVFSLKMQQIKENSYEFTGSDFNQLSFLISDVFFQLSLSAA